MVINGKLSEELILWAKEYGIPTTAKSGAVYYGFDYKGRKRAEAIVILVRILKDLGAEKGSFYGPSKDEIVTFIIKEHAFQTTKKYRGACNAVREELAAAVLEVFGSESEYYKQNGKTREIVQEKSELEKEQEAAQAAERKLKEEAEIVIESQPEEELVKEYDHNNDDGVIPKERELDLEMEELLGSDDE